MHSSGIIGFCNHYLSRHHFCVCTTNLDSSIQASSVMGLHYVSAISFVSAHTAIVWTCKKNVSNPDYKSCSHQENAFTCELWVTCMFTLWPRETVGWPAKRMSICAQNGVLLLHAKPRMLLIHHVHHLLACQSKVGLWRGRERKKKSDQKTSTSISMVLKITVQNSKANLTTSKFISKYLCEMSPQYKKKFTESLCARLKLKL